MSKELTPLEALYDLFENPFYIELGRVQGKTRFYKDIQIIEKGLKDSEWYKKEMIKFEKAFTEENEEKLKLKQAFEIIKEKGFVPKVFNQVDTVIDYNDCVRCGYYGVYAIEVEEFDLLKEALK